MNKKALIYDFDGVISNSVNIKTDAFCQIYKEYGKKIVSQVKSHHLKNGGVSRFEKFKYYHKNFLNIDLNKNQVEALASKFSRIVLNNVIESNYILGAYDFIKQKSSNYHQYICTGTPQNEIEIILKEKKISDFFIGIYGSPEPKSSIIKKIINEKKYSNSDLIFFGDASTDYYAAEKCGIDFVAINSFESFPNAIYSFKNFKELEKCQLF